MSGFHWDFNWIIWDVQENEANNCPLETNERSMFPARKTEIAKGLQKVDSIQKKGIQAVLALYQAS